jgi:heat shock protein HslJ
MRARLAALLAALVILGVAVACDDAVVPSGSLGPAPDAFLNVGWSVVSIRGQAPVPDSEPSIAFSATHVKGSGGCNQFGGNYRYDPSTGAIAFDQLAMTAMGCLDQRVGSVETAFMQALTQADHLDLDADARLHLTGAGGEIVFAKMLEG